MYNVHKEARDITLENYFIKAGIRYSNNMFYHVYRDKLKDYMNTKEETAFNINKNISF